MRQLFKLFGNFQRKSISAFNVICPCASNTAHGQCRVLWTICIWDEVLTCSNITSALVQGVGWSCFGSWCECCPSWLPNQMISLIFGFLCRSSISIFLYLYFNTQMTEKYIVQQCASAVPVWLVGMCSEHEVNITGRRLSSRCEGPRVTSGPGNLRLCQGKALAPLPPTATDTTITRSINTTPLSSSTSIWYQFYGNWSQYKVVNCNLWATLLYLSWARGMIYHTSNVWSDVDAMMA